MVGFIVMGLSWASIGAFLVMRRPENAVGLLLVICGAGYALTMFFAALAFAFAAQGTEAGDRLAEFAGWATLLANQVGAFGFLILLHLPDGPGAIAGLGTVHSACGADDAAWSSVIVLTQPGPLHLTPSLNNPFSIGPDLRGGEPFSPLVTLFTIIAAPRDPAHARDALPDGRAHRAAAAQVVRARRGRLDLPASHSRVGARC